MSKHINKGIISGALSATVMVPGASPIPSLSLSHRIHCLLAEIMSGLQFYDQTADNSSNLDIQSKELIAQYHLLLHLEYLIRQLEQLPREASPVNEEQSRQLCDHINSIGASILDQGIDHSMLDDEASSMARTLGGELKQFYNYDQKDVCSPEINRLLSYTFPKIQQKLENYLARELERAGRNGNGEL